MALKDGRAKILFITSTRLGDGVLSTGALDHFIRRYPEARITVAYGGLVEGIFAAAPGVERVIVLKKEPYLGHWRKLARETLGMKWDVVVDLRNSLLSRLIRDADAPDAAVFAPRYMWT